LAERRRLSSFYREPLRPIFADIKNYIEQKKKLLSKGADILADSELSGMRNALTGTLAEIELHPDEIVHFSEKFISAAKKIETWQREIARTEKRLKVSSSRELRALGRTLIDSGQRAESEKKLGLNSDEIKEMIREVQ